MNRHDSPRRTYFQNAANSGLMPLVLNAASNNDGYGAIESNMRPLSRTGSFFHVAGLVDDRGGNLEKYRMDMDTVKDRKKSVRKFYEAQNELLDMFAEVDALIDDSTIGTSDEDLEARPLLPRTMLAKDEGTPRLVKVMIFVNLAVNVVLLAAKIVVILLSNSISLIASTVDSAMDLLATTIIAGSNALSETRSWRQAYEWPVGRKRMEPMGVVIFSVAMIASFLQVFIESIQRLAKHELNTANLGPPALVVMGVTIVVKLIMWLWCRSSKSSSVKALAQDAENDVVFNIASLLFPIIGQVLHMPILDPIGGTLLSLYIIREWFDTLVTNVRNLTGRRASPHEHQRVCYLITRFSPLVRGVQHVEVYSAGDEHIVEADVVLPPHISLPLCALAFTFARA